MENEKPSEKPSEERSVVQQRLPWQVAWRDDTKVGQALYAGEPIEEMHQLSDVGLLDEFFVFLGTGAQGQYFSAAFQIDSQCRENHGRIGLGAMPNGEMDEHPA